MPCPARAVIDMWREPATHAADAKVGAMDADRVDTVTHTPGHVSTVPPGNLLQAPPPRLEAPRKRKDPSKPATLVDSWLIYKHSSPHSQLA